MNQKQDLNASVAPAKKRCLIKVKLQPDNFEITRRAGITDTGFCRFTAFTYQPAIPLISHFRLAPCFF